MSEKPLTTPLSEAEICLVLHDTTERVLTTAEIAEELPIGHRATLKRLSRLADKGIVHSKKAGPKARVWWLDLSIVKDDLRLIGRRDGNELEKLSEAAKYSISDRHVTQAYWRGRNSRG